MKSTTLNQRRRFVLSTASAVIPLSGLALSACEGSTVADRQLQFATLAVAQAEVLRLAGARSLVTEAKWTWAQTLAHCAQSIEYSMNGFPQLKPALFQRTLGAAALGVFAWRGRMSHDLAEPIPGAPALEPLMNAANALARLQAAIQSFESWTAPLLPHFAYGELDKPAYEQAHAMHLANHLSAFQVAS